ncbi:CoA transferase [Embleya scabrispora]|uniref:CoA transferase n=1 Tax=Embleya scabrispora TaxID=159449 RepID=UPI00037BCBA1|nr:CoA transferase [Embleya scabrispora]MYS83731.1 CoA transferase [Streptomyces sp. SID5474]
MRTTPAQLLDHAWRALGGNPADRAHITLTGPEYALSSALPVTALAQASIGAVALAARELGAARGGSFAAPVVLDSRAAATAIASDRHLRLAGEPLVSMHPLSRFHRSADGWVRLHGNYPHHRAAAFTALGVDSVEAAIDALAGLTGGQIEELLAAHGALGFAVREPSEWATHPQGASIAALPLLDLTRTAAGDPWCPAPDPAPAAGVRILDLTRVLAGPTGTRTLAHLGADVLRVDSPNLPENPGEYWDNAFGKRSSLLDLRDRADRARFDELLGQADVLITGYRTDAMAALGLDQDTLGARHPGLITAAFNAWGPGPWANRRGFDSLVQGACGIARIEAGEAPDPGALPTQALDRATGYLLAAAVLRALTLRLADHRGSRIDLALARTAHWLTGAHAPGEPEVAEPYDPTPYLATTDTAVGPLTHALPPFELPGLPAAWAHPPTPWGSDAPVWRSA